MSSDKDNNPIQMDDIVSEFHCDAILLIVLCDLDDEMLEKMLNILVVYPLAKAMHELNCHM